uniref:Uncharacterized protein n=1 Tax=Setaria italica TaxID=4555 RepID=K3YBE4_SETIT
MVILQNRRKFKISSVRPPTGIHRKVSIIIQDYNSSMDHITPHNSSCKSYKLKQKANSPIFFGPREENQECP